MTGRAAGFCAGFGVPGSGTLAAVQGCRPWGGNRGGGGRGFRNWFYGTGLTGWQRAGGVSPAFGNPFVYGAPYCAPVTPSTSRDQELATLKTQAEHLERTLEGIRRQLKDLEADEGGPKGG